MRAVGGRILSWAAIYAVALHAILLGLVPPLAAGVSSFDPLSEICHSVAADESAGQPLHHSGFIPGHACEHCSLSGAYAPPVEPNGALASILAPARVLDVLRPASAMPQLSPITKPRFARGPPLLA